MTYIVRDFDVENSAQCQRLADMFNDWDSSWPGGFTRGARETASRVEEQHRRAQHLAVLIVESENDSESESENEMVGYCNLEAQPGQKELAYIGLLGARLSAHGKGVGKQLLREMVRRVTMLGYKQVTLHTWAGNTKAVPLYKKTGFHWVPETDVYMRNFLPTILNMPLVQTFLQGRDWYDCLDREIVVASDDVTWKGMKVYPYRFRNGDRTLSLVFDAAGEGLTAIETDAFAFSCVVGVEEAPAGQTYPVVWDMASKQEAELNVVLLAEAEPGLALSVQEHIHISGTKSLQRDLLIDSGVVPKPDGEPAYRIKTTFLIEGQPLLLETGVKVVRPVEIDYGGQKLLSGREEKIIVRLQSRLERDLVGTLALVAHSDLECVVPIQAFTLPAKGWTQCVFLVTARGAGVFETTLSLVSEALHVERTVNLRALNGMQVLGSIDPTTETALLESQDICSRTSLRGGGMTISAGPSARDCLHMEMAQAGPPYNAEQLRPPLWNAQIEHANGGDVMRLAGKAEARPTLRVERTVTHVGAGVAKIVYRVYNLSEQPVSTKLRLRSWGKLQGHLTLPLQAGVLRLPLQGLQDDTHDEHDLLAPGTALAENWIATEQDGYVAGIVFAGQPEQERRWTRLVNLTYDLDTIPAYGMRETPDVYAVAGNGNWETVRRWWRQLVQPAIVQETQAPELLNALDIQIRPTLLRNEAQTVTVAVTNRRGQALTGKLTLSGDVALAPSQFDVEGINRDKSFAANATLQMPHGCSAHFVTAHLDTIPVADTRRIGIVRLGTQGEARVTSSKAAEFKATEVKAADIETSAHDYIEVDSDVLRFRVAPTFLGAMIALEQNGINHLLSSYPTPTPFVWTNPWYGGLHPLRGWAGDSRLTREMFSGEAITRVGGEGNVWQGVRVTCVPQHKTLRWMRLETEYLTTAGSNVIALVTRCTNLSGARMETPSDIGVGAWLQVDGTHTNAIVHGEFNGARQARRRGGFGIEDISSGWLAIENAETGKTALLIMSSPQGKVDVVDFPEQGAHLALQWPCSLEPGETKEMLGWMVLTEDHHTIEAYAATLAACRQLP